MQQVIDLDQPIGARVKVKSASAPHKGVGIIIGELGDDPRWKEVLFPNSPDPHGYAAWELERVSQKAEQ